MSLYSYVNQDQTTSDKRDLTKYFILTRNFFNYATTNSECDKLAIEDKDKTRTNILLWPQSRKFTLISKQNLFADALFSTSLIFPLEKDNVASHSWLWWFVLSKNLRQIDRLQICSLGLF